MEELDSMFCLEVFWPPSHIECWRKLVLAGRRLVKFSSTDIVIADGMLLKFCKRSTELYGKSAITPNMHIHCHLSSWLQAFGPIHSFWLLSFEGYNRILDEQPSNDQSIEMQLMSLFQKDNLHLHLQEEVKQLPNLFLNAFPNPSYDISFPRQFDKSVSPGRKSRYDFFSCKLFKNCLINVYGKLYLVHEQLFRADEIFIPSIFRKIMYHYVARDNVNFYIEQKCKELLCVSFSSFPFYYCLFCVMRARNASRSTVHIITHYSLTW